METKIGYFASIEQYKPMDALEQAVRAEKTGFESIWVDDHFHPWYHTDAQSGQAWAWMGATLQATKKVFGTYSKEEDYKNKADQFEKIATSVFALNPAENDICVNLTEVNAKKTPTPVPTYKPRVYPTVKNTVKPTVTPTPKQQ